MKTILITGATGFLGSNLIKKLIKRKYLLICLIRNKSNLTKLQYIKNNKNIKFFNYEKKKLKEIFFKNKIEGIVHCATNYGLNISETKEIINSNLIFPLDILKLAVEFRVKFFINSDTILNKNISEYTLSKQQFNDWLKFFSHSIKICNVKLEHFYGPGDNATKFVINLILNLISKKESISFTPGNQTRDFIYIDDVVNAFLKIIDFTINNDFIYQEFEVGTQNYIKLKKFVKIVKKLCKNKKTKLNFGALKYRINEKMTLKVDIKNLEKLGWKPKFTLNQGLIRTIKYYEK